MNLTGTCSAGATWGSSPSTTVESVVPALLYRVSIRVNLGGAPWCAPDSSVSARGGGRFKYNFFSHCEKKSFSDPSCWSIVPMRQKNEVTYERKNFLPLH